VLAGKSQAGRAQVINDLIGALWRVNLMLALKRSFFNKVHILMNVLKALAPIISMCSLHVILLSKITSIFYLITD
jgi:hypothetical protein